MGQQTVVITQYIACYDWHCRFVFIIVVAARLESKSMCTLLIHMLLGQI